MAYIGIQTQISRNNRNTVLLLIGFPVLLLALVYGVLFFSNGSHHLAEINHHFLVALPFVLAGTGIWFAIAWVGHTAFINRATGANALARSENLRVYNLVENLCISQGMKLPKIYVIEDDSLNAYASGISNATYALTFSRGIIAKLDDAELEGVIAHELTHIQNRDVRLLIVSIVFAGIFSRLAYLAMNTGSGRRGKNKSLGPVVIVLTLLALLVSTLLRFGISRRREYMADAGAAQLTRNPRALASALRKIAIDPAIEAVKNEDVAQLFIEKPAASKKWLTSSWFATHPPIEKRIQILEDF